MGPRTLFDKSFLQSLSVDESVWFAHFFYPIVCPLFYVETLADLEKAVREGRTSEQEVGIIADKFPDASGSPCPHHWSLAISNLLGADIPMRGQIPRDGGRLVQIEGKRGMIYDRSPTEIAFSRWQERRFMDVERSLAKSWREDLDKVDLNAIAAKLQAFGIDARSCQSLNAAHSIARALVTGTNKPWERIALALTSLQVPDAYRQHIVERWSVGGKKSIEAFAPYAAHVLCSDLFFLFALAAGHIGTGKASNRVDMAYYNGSGSNQCSLLAVA